MTASAETSLDFQDIYATTAMSSNTNNHSSHTLIKHISNSKGTGCASSECTVAEVNKCVFTATDGDGYINKDDSSFFVSSLHPSLSVFSQKTDSLTQMLTNF